MNAEVIGGIVRHVLTALGGYFVATGALDDATVQTIIGAVVTLVGIGWSVWQKTQADAKLQDAIAAPAGWAKP